MKAYKAWVEAKRGQKIHRVSRPGIVFEKLFEWYKEHLVDINRVFGVDFSANDWEVVKEKHQLTFTNVEISGIIGDDPLTNSFRKKGIKKPDLFTKVAFEWEE